MNAMKLLLLVAIAGFAGLALAQNPQLKIAMDVDADGEIAKEAVLGAYTSELLKLPYVTLVSEKNAADAVLEVRCLSWRAKTGLGCHLVENLFTDRLLGAKIKAAPFANPADLALALSLAAGTLARPEGGGHADAYFTGNADVGRLIKSFVHGLDIREFKNLLATKQ